jgi:hypothetical protein
MKCTRTERPKWVQCARDSSDRCRWSNALTYRFAWSSFLCRAIVAIEAICRWGSGWWFLNRGAARLEQAERQRIQIDLMNERWRFTRFESTANDATNSIERLIRKFFDTHLFECLQLFVRCWTEWRQIVSEILHERLQEARKRPSFDIDKRIDLPWDFSLANAFRCLS